MEIKELIPKSKEILVRPKEQDGIFYDVFSYTIKNSVKSTSANSVNGNNKAYLYIVSQVQSNDPSLDYIPNLIASFIKRELESGSNSIEDNIFENSLKKANDLIESLIKDNADIKLDLGVAFINKEKISLAKIGKSKMLIYRLLKKETFDVFENIGQFNKSHITNKRFSNIISGEIKKGDKLFFFIPNNRLNFKQKMITATLSKSDTEGFVSMLHKIISPAADKKDNGSPIPCSGLYLEINEETKKIQEEPIKEIDSSAPAKETKIFATEVSKVDKSNAIKKTVEKFKEMVLGEGLGSINSNNRGWRLKNRGISNYFIVGVITLVIIAGLFLLTRGDSKLKEEIASINEKLRVSESRFLLKQNYEAREILADAFKELDLIEENKEKNEVMLAAIGLLNRIEKVDSTKKPAVLLDLVTYQGAQINGLKNILAGGGKVFVGDNDKLYQANDGELKPLESSVGVNLVWIKNNKIIIYGTGIEIIDLDENKIRQLRKRFNFEPVEMKNYEDNLYFLGSKNIYKITNALVNPLEELEWLKSGEAEKVPGNFAAFDLDSNIFVVTDQRKLATFFKGELTESYDLNFAIGPGVELVNLGNPEKSPNGDHGASNEFMIVDKTDELARVVDDLGNLKVSYDLSGVDIVKDAFFDKEVRTLYLLSPTKIWELKI